MTILQVPDNTDRYPLDGLQDASRRIASNERVTVYASLHGNGVWAYLQSWELDGRRRVILDLEAEDGTPFYNAYSLADANHYHLHSDGSLQTYVENLSTSLNL